MIITSISKIVTIELCLGAVCLWIRACYVPGMGNEGYCSSCPPSMTSWVQLVGLAWADSARLSSYILNPVKVNFNPLFGKLKDNGTLTAFCCILTTIKQAASTQNSSPHPISMHTYLAVSPTEHRDLLPNQHA